MINFLSQKLGFETIPVLRLYVSIFKLSVPQKKHFLSVSSIAESSVVRIQSGSVDLICVFSLHSDSMLD